MSDFNTFIQITQVLKNNGCTFDNTEQLLKDVIRHYKELREHREYKTVADYMTNNKTYDAGMDVVPALTDSSVIK